MPGCLEVLPCITGGYLSIVEHLKDPDQPSQGPGCSLQLVAAPARCCCRCAAALVYGKQLALLPSIQTDVLEQLLQVGGCAAMP